MAGQSFFMLLKIAILAPKMKRNNGQKGSLEADSTVYVALITDLLGFQIEKLNNACR